MRIRSYLRPLGYGSIAGALAVGLGFGFAPRPDNSSTVVALPAVASVTTAELRTSTDSDADPEQPAADASIEQAASRKIAYSRSVWAIGGQQQIDQCRGLVQVRFDANRSVVAQHNTCGGAWILKVKQGQLIKLTGKLSGTYRAVSFKSVPRGSSISALNGMSSAGIVLQTCYFNSNLMRLVGLQRVG